MLIEMLGERIREIRKRKKMTLEALAGEELTKGMLSLIENNKAKPSMESLAYIAKRLGVEVTELLEEVSSLELREVLEKAEKLYNVKLDKSPERYRQIAALIEPYLESLSNGYESARLLDIYSRVLYHDKKEGWRELSDRAAIMYDEMMLTAKRASIGIFRAIVKFQEHDYSESLSILLSERTELEANHAYIDPMTRVDLDYNEAILHFAVGDSDSATCVMESAIDFSKEHRIFYRIDDLYRLAAAHGEMTRDEKKKRHFTLKLKQYGEFADDTFSLVFYDVFTVMSLISEQKAYAEALVIIDDYLSDPKLADSFEDLFFLEKGKAFYGLKRYEEAISYLEKAKTTKWAHHPFDLSLVYISEVYKALCYHELGNRDKALQISLEAVENYRPLPASKYKDFANETYRIIQESGKNSC
ncbi:helix-turn-helix transcriptional regulator [Neobacillus drentensis]